MTRMARELGPIFWLDMMGTPLVVVSGHDLVDELSDEKRFDKSVKGSLRRVRAVAGDGLFTAYTNEPNWSKAHNILMQAVRQPCDAVLPPEHDRYASNSSRSGNA